MDVAPELGSSFDGVVAPEDIAVYGGLCALATFSREEMRQRVLDNASFKNFFDLVPQVCTRMMRSVRSKRFPLKKKAATLCKGIRRRSSGLPPGSLPPSFACKC